MSAVDPSIAGALAPVVEDRARPRRSPPAAFARLVRSEIGLIAGRRRNQVGLLILASVPLILGISVWYTAPAAEAGGPPFFSSISQNGMFVAMTALIVQMPLFLPLAAAALSGDAVAGESGGGTLRYVLTVPVGRIRLLLAKYLAAVVGIFIGVAVITATGVLIGLVLFGGGPVLTLSGFELSYPQGLARVGWAALYATAAMSAVLAIGLLVSTLTEQPIAAMITVVIVTMAMQILGSLDQLSWLHPYLLSEHWTASIDLFREPVFTDGMLAGLQVFAGYVLVGLTLAMWRFRTKDITS